MKLIRLRRKLMAAALVREFRGSDDRELRQLRRKLKRPLLEDKWKKQQEARMAVIAEHRRTPGQLLEKRNALYEEYLVADKKDDVNETIKLQAKIMALDYVMGGSDDI